MKVTDKHVFFWGQYLSNWHEAPFTVEYEGKKYRFHNTEQYFMFVKAKTFGDDEIAKEIIVKGKNPAIAKALGRKVKNYDDKVWNEKRYQVMLEANMEKYTQNEILKNSLLNKKYDGKHFVEASPYDTIWGIGVGEKEAKDDESNWRGTNLLGKVLDEVRNKLISHQTNEA